MKVNGSIAVVTGAGRNIGKAIAIEIADRGAKVLAIDLDEKELLKIDNPNIEICVCDASDEFQVSSIISDFANKNGRIDLLINAAGWISSSPLFNPLKQQQDRKHSVELWRKTLRLNLDTTFIMTTHVVEEMIKRRTQGVIINISSVTAKGNIGQSAYSAAKAGVDALSRTWALELGPFGIRSISIAPGFIDTPSTKEALAPHYLEEWISKTALRKLGNMKDIAHTVVYIAENDYLTGTILHLDGGLAI